MKVLTILGSPKKNGNTARTLDAFEQSLQSMGHQASRIHVTDYQINGCLGCMSCMRHDNQPGCVQKDDAMMIFDKMIDTDAIVYASPNYGWDFSGQLKLFLDRHLCLVKGYRTPLHKSFIEGKPISVLITTMGPDGEPNTDLLHKMVARLGGYLKGNPSRIYVVPGSIQPDFDVRAKETAKKMALDITS